MKKIILPVIAIALALSNCAPPRPATAPAKPAPAPPVKHNNPPAPAAPAPSPVTVATVNTLSRSEKAAGWKLLFDGSSTDGWHAYGSRSIGNAWKPINGTLFLDAGNKEGWQVKSGGDIVTDEEYGNFELQLDWKIDHGGNSGICFYVKEDKNKYPHMWSTGPEFQLLDNDSHSDGKIPKHRAGDLYDLISAKPEPVVRPLEWNHVLIRANNGRLDFYLNEVHILSTQLWGDAWQRLIAGSKFKNMPDFGTFHTGRIGLQDHGNSVWFRNIKIRRL